VLIRHSNTCGGYIWIYKKDYTLETLKKRLEKTKLFLKNKGSVINSQKKKEKVNEIVKTNEIIKIVKNH